MGLLASLVSWLSTSQPGGIRLDEPDPWEVTATQDVERFLRALPVLAPEGAMVYFEATGEKHVAERLRQLSVPATVHVAAGTIWPRPDCHHVPLTVEGMEGLAAFLEANAAGYFCSHCHVYDTEGVLLEWHDAFGRDPMRLSRRVPRETVVKFASAAGVPSGRSLDATEPDMQEPR